VLTEIQDAALRSDCRRSIPPCGPRPVGRGLSRSGHSASPMRASGRGADPPPRPEIPPPAARSTAGGRNHRPGL